MGLSGNSLSQKTCTIHSLPEIGTHNSIDLRHSRMLLAEIHADGRDPR